MFEGLDQINCFSSNHPTYFVTRYDQRAGMDKFFTLEKKIPSKQNEYFLGIFSIKSHCEGRTLSISDLYGSAMQVQLQMK
jgi:hypothetical protein